MATKAKKKTTEFKGPKNAPPEVKKAHDKSKDAAAAQKKADEAVQKAKDEERGPIGKLQKEADKASADARTAADEARAALDAQVMEKKIGRPLREDESVRHINGDLNDRKRENLELRSPAIDAAEKRLGRALNQDEREKFWLEEVDEDVELSRAAAVEDEA